MDSFSGDHKSPKPLTVWQENHGNWLLGLVVLIGLVGAIVLAMADRQSNRQNINGGQADLSDQIASIEEDATSDDGDLITIVVNGAADDSGQMMLAIYDAENQFNDPTLAALKSSRLIVDGTATWVIAAKKLPEAFAIAAFHDRDADGLLNRSVFGIPMEPYGFSNQASGKFGPPSFDQAVLSRPEGSQTIDVFLGSTAQ
ncbi:MAG: DUF2141 domain-containing protein [Pirellulaceae bacterium]